MGNKSKLSEAGPPEIISRTVGYVGKWKIDELTKFYPKEDIAEKGIQIISLQ